MAGAKSRTYTQEYVEKYLQEHSNYIVIGKFEGAHKPLLCQCSNQHQFNLYFSEYLFRGRGCKQCAQMKQKGEGHWNWQNGGHQDVFDALRHSIIPWKKECLAESGYKCDISGESSKDLVVHHAEYNFRTLVDKALENTNLPLYNYIAEYSIEDRKKLENELLKLHTIENGKVMKKEYHDEFHQIYGKTNNTLDQYNEFKTRKRQELIK